MPVKLLNTSGGAVDLVFNGNSDTQVDVSHLSAGVSIPIGTIIGFFGSAIPTGWTLCNGQKGTPNLMSKFIRGTGTFGSSTTGGSANVALIAHTHTATVADAPAHGHTASHTSNTSTCAAHKHAITKQIVPSRDVVLHGLEGMWGARDKWVTTNVGNHSHTIGVPAKTLSSAGGHTHTATLANSGGTGAGKNIPPFVRVAYIMKTS